MLRSIQAECYKVVHRPYFWITTILCALFSVGVIFCLYLIKTEASGVNPVNMPFAVSALLFGMPRASTWSSWGWTWCSPSSISTTP